jgi:hypothetical protein
MQTQATRWRLHALLASLGSVALLPALGCNKMDDGMSQEQLQKASRLSEIAKKADGDWNKVPPADRDYILKTFTSGSESGAKMLVLASSGKFRGGPGVAPPGAPAAPPGAPGGPPGKAAVPPGPPQ